MEYFLIAHLVGIPIVVVFDKAWAYWKKDLVSISEKKSNAIVYKASFFSPILNNKSTDLSLIRSGKGFLDSKVKDVILFSDHGRFVSLKYPDMFLISQRVKKTNVLKITYFHKVYKKSGFLKDYYFDSYEVSKIL